MNAPTVGRTIKKPKVRTKLHFGPADHGRAVTERQAEGAEYVGGFKYEIIDGRLYVSPSPNIPENRLERWLRRAVERYSDEHPATINYVTPKGRVYLPKSIRITVPEPDLAAYANFPDEDERPNAKWNDVSPLLVAEVLVEGSIEKDLGRNPDLYLSVPSIQEYWVVDGSVDSRQPSLIQYVRRGKKWSITIHPFGSTFTPKVLPGFSLVINPREQ